MTTVGVRRDQDGRHCYAVSHDDRVTTSSVRPVVLRNGAGVEDPLGIVLGASARRNPGSHPKDGSTVAP